MSSLRAFLQLLEDNGEVLRIDDPLSRMFEVAGFLKKFDGKKVLLFENVKDSKTKIVGGVCGSRDRILMALNVEQENFYTNIMEAMKNPVKCERGNGPVNEVNIEDIRIDDVPILTHFRKDPGPYITSGVVYARIGEKENISFHRLLVLDKNRLTIRIVPRQLYRLTQMARERGLKSIDISICIGLHPTILFAAALPTPFGVSEFDIANNLLEGKLKLTECTHIDAMAPVDSELVLEGKLRLNETHVEGPFIDLTGTYDIERRQPVVEIVGMMHREDYIYQGLLPSGSEHRLLMGMPREVRIWEYTNNVIPTIKGVNMTMGGMGWLHCVVSFEKFKEGDSKNVLMAMFAAHPSMKHAIVVDEDINPYDMEQVEWAIATRFKGDEDILLIPNVRVSSLDPASDQDRELGCKVGIDATKPIFKKQQGFIKGEIPVSSEIEKILRKYED